jgi:hypothetical protein
MSLVKMVGKASGPVERSETNLAPLGFDHRIMQPVILVILIKLNLPLLPNIGSFISIFITTN